MRVSGGNIQISPSVTYGIAPNVFIRLDSVSKTFVSTIVSVVGNSIVVSATEDYSITVIRWP